MAKSPTTSSLTDAHTPVTIIPGEPHFERIPLASESIPSTSAKKLSYVLSPATESYDWNNSETDSEWSDAESDDADRESSETALNDDPCYLIVDTELLKLFLSQLVLCKLCQGNVNIIHEVDKKQGFANYITVKCLSDTCDWSNTLCTSKTVKTPKGRPPFDINLRSVIAFREIGKGLTAMKKYCGFMNMPNTMNKTAYKKLYKNCRDTYVKVATTSMQNAAAEIRHKELGETFTEDSIADFTISTDGAWQRRGHASLNGIITVVSIDNAKCIDYVVLTKKCKQCQWWGTRKDNIEYSAFVAEHDCPINHKGSASSMEPAGVLTCFERSIERNKLRYTTYIGDGDSSSYSTVSKADPYKGTPINKGECVGHVQKRLGTRLRAMKKQMGKTPLSDGKTIAGQGRLTDKVMNKMQCYFGMAIRSNTSSLFLMKKGVGAVLFHCSTADSSATRHMYCPRDENTWCRYWKAVNRGVGDTFEEKDGLPESIKKILRPIFDDLGNDNLLGKCLHGMTQNNNESLNGVVWKRVPKDICWTRNIGDRYCISCN